ncbi:MAG: diguanylate cyclase [Alcanivorax sp.]|nr:diguanylate cyclase [Alcanivorax sp.]
MTAVTASLGTESHSLALLNQHLSFCQRHQLPLSLLAIHFRNLASLAEEIGIERIRQLKTTLSQHLSRIKRLEDSQITWHRGYLILSLPGTDARGAHTLATRINQSVNQLELDINEYQVCLQTNIALHCHLPGNNDSARELVTNTLCLLASKQEPAPLILSERARQNHQDTPNSEQRQQGLSRELCKLVRLGDAGALLSTLSPAIQQLDEARRLQLVDMLLEASLNQPAAASRLAGQ